MLYLQTVAPDTLELLKELFSRSEIERAKTTHSLLPVHEGGNCYLSLYGVLLNPSLLNQIFHCYMRTIVYKLLLVTRL